MGLIANAIEKENIKTYQMEVVEFNKVSHGYDNKQLGVEKHVKYNCFTLPEGMTEEQAYSVLSYYYKKISHNLAKDNNVIITKEMIANNLNANLETLGFNISSNTELVKTLYVVQSNSNWKLRLRYQFKGEKWYNSQVTKEEVEEIYLGLGLDMPTLKVDTLAQADCTTDISIN